MYGETTKKSKGIIFTQFQFKIEEERCDKEGN